MIILIILMLPIMSQSKEDCSEMCDNCGNTAYVEPLREIYCSLCDECSGAFNSHRVENSIATSPRMESITMPKREMINKPAITKRRRPNRRYMERDLSACGEYYECLQKAAASNDLTQLRHCTKPSDCEEIFQNVILDDQVDQPSPRYRRVNRHEEHNDVDICKRYYDCLKKAEMDGESPRRACYKPVGCDSHYDFLNLEPEDGSYLAGDEPGRAARDFGVGTSSTMYPFGQTVTVSQVTNQNSMYPCIPLCMNMCPCPTNNGGSTTSAVTTSPTTTKPKTTPKFGWIYIGVPRKGNRKPDLMQLLM